MAYYIKVTLPVADALGVTALRNRTADGCVLLWQADLDRIAGDTIFDRAARVGGAALTPQDAKAETDGSTEYPVKVTTPEEYRQEEDRTPSIEELPALQDGNSKTESSELSAKELPGSQKEGGDA